MIDLDASGALVSIDPAPERVLDHHPTLVLVPPALDEAQVAEWQSSGVEVVEVAPHGFVDVHGAMRAVDARVAFVSIDEDALWLGRPIEAACRVHVRCSRRTAPSESKPVSGRPSRARVAPRSGQ